MKVLVTGAAGFIGSAIVRRMVAAGHQVIAVDNLLGGNLDNLAEVMTEIEFANADVRDLSAMTDLCDQVSLIFHEAAVPSVPKSIEDPLFCHQHNVEGTLSILLAARAGKVKRIVYAASSAAYGDAPELPKQERMVPAPISPYAVQKLTGELYMQSFARVYDMETVCLRYFNVFGPLQSADSPYSGVLAKFITTMLAGTRPTIYGNGQQSRDFVYVDNVVEANILAATAPASIVSGNIYNVAHGDRHSLLDTFQALKEITGFQEDPLFAPERPGDIMHSFADVSLAKSDLGYHPQVSFHDGLRRTVNWYANTLGFSLRKSLG